MPVYYRFGQDSSVKPGEDMLRFIRSGKDRLAMLSLVRTGWAKVVQVRRVRPISARLRQITPGYVMLFLLGQVRV